MTCECGQPLSSPFVLTNKCHSSFFYGLGVARLTMHPVAWITDWQAVDKGYTKHKMSILGTHALNGPGHASLSEK